ncbi:hypothetical protein N9948_00750 [bacterium]|nr:hypothetical protein [bacterium]
MEEKELDYRNKEAKEAVNEFERYVEDFQDSGESQDFLIITNDHVVQGALLEIIDKLDLDHQIELDGRVFVTID